MSALTSWLRALVGAAVFCALALALAALLVPAGYFAFEAALYGAPAAWANVGFNTLQCLVGAAAAHVLALAVRAAAGGSR